MAPSVEEMVVSSRAGVLASPGSVLHASQLNLYGELIPLRLVGDTEWVKVCLGKRRKGIEMPYKQITQLPDNVKNNLPKHAQEIYKEAFNSAEEQYREEDRAHRVAWSAVEQKYEKNEKGNWVKKDS
jgi:cation transport regulator